MTCEPCEHANEHEWWGKDDAGKPRHHCRDCHATWFGTTVGHCSECHLTFGSDSAYSAHLPGHGIPTTEDGEPKLFADAKGILRWPGMPADVLESRRNASLRHP